jgi:hypothetical protein
MAAGCRTLYPTDRGLVTGLPRLCVIYEKQSSWVTSRERGTGELCTQAPLILAICNHVESER